MNVMSIANEYWFIKREVGLEPYEKDEIAVIKKDKLEKVTEKNNTHFSIPKWRLRTSESLVLIFDEDHTGNFDGTIITNQHDIDRFYAILEALRSRGYSESVIKDGLKISKPESQED